MLLFVGFSVLNRFGGKDGAPPAGGQPSAAGWEDGFSLTADQRVGAWLVVLDGANAGRTYRLTERPVTIGRAPANAVQVPDSDVSRKHCLVRGGDAGFEVVDMNSKFGTRLDGKRISKATLNEGAIVTVGSTNLRFEQRSAHALDYGMGRKEKSDETDQPTEFVDATKKTGASGGTDLRERLMELVRLASVVSKGLPRPQLLAEVGASVNLHIGADRVLFLTKNEQGGWGLEAHHPRPGLAPELGRVPPAKPLMSKAISTGQAVAARATKGGGPAPSSALAQPIFSNDAVVGVLYCDRLGPDRPEFAADDLSFLQQISLRLAP